MARFLPLLLVAAAVGVLVGEAAVTQSSELSEAHIREALADEGMTEGAINSKVLSVITRLVGEEVAKKNCGSGPSKNAATRKAVAAGPSKNAATRTDRGRPPRPFPQPGDNMEYIKANAKVVPPKCKSSSRPGIDYYSEQSKKLGRCKQLQAPEAALENRCMWMPPGQRGLVEAEEARQLQKGCEGSKVWL
jgi:hypothetical protein